MLFKPLRLTGAYVIELKSFSDERGEFVKSFSKEAFKQANLESDYVECNISRNRIKGTLRGLHRQIAPHQEVKVIFCTKGSLYDVIVDLRPDSPTYKEWIAIELHENKREMIYIPRGFAHGFQTLEDDTELFYYVSACYRPESERGVRWNDPALGIHWPLEITCMSEKDRRYEDLT